MKLVECPCCHFNQRYKGSGLKTPKCQHCGSYIPVKKEEDDDDFITLNDGRKEKITKEEDDIF